MNQKRALSTQCTEDQFEVIMAFFEATAQSKQPFAAVDSPPVVSYEEMENSFDESIDENARIFTREVYQHWKTERIKRGNRQLTPSLKVRCAQVRVGHSLTLCSSRPARKRTIQIRTYVSVDVKCVPSVRHEAGMPRVRRS
jgi:hypothetical protein